MLHLIPKEEPKVLEIKLPKKLSFRENGCKEPINENIKPLSADKNENKYNKIKKLYFNVYISFSNNITCKEN